jgi:hypothetical protein
MEDLKKVLEFVEKRIKKNEFKRILNYANFETKIYEAKQEELQEVKRFIEELINQKQEGR